MVQVLASLPVCQDLKAAEYPYHRHMDIRPTTGCHLVVLRHDLYQSVNLENLAESDLSWGSNWTAVVLMDGHPVVRPHIVGTAVCRVIHLGRSYSLCGF